MRTPTTHEEFQAFLDEELYTPDQGAAALSNNLLTAWCARYADTFLPNSRVQQVDLAIDGAAPYNPETHDELETHFRRILPLVRGSDMFVVWVPHSDDPVALDSYAWQLNDAPTTEEALAVPMPKHATGLLLHTILGMFRDSGIRASPGFLLVGPWQDRRVPDLTDLRYALSGFTEYSEYSMRADARAVMRDEALVIQQLFGWVRSWAPTKRTKQFTLLIDPAHRRVFDTLEGLGVAATHVTLDHAVASPYHDLLDSLRYRDNVDDESLETRVQLVREAELLAFTALRLATLHPDWTIGIIQGAASSEGYQAARSWDWQLARQLATMCHGWLLGELPTEIQQTCTQLIARFERLVTSAALRSEQDQPLGNLRARIEAAQQIVDLCLSLHR